MRTACWQWRLVGQMQRLAAAADRQTGDTVARRVSAFDQQGLASLERKHGGGQARKDGLAERGRILRVVGVCDPDAEA